MIVLKKPYITEKTMKLVEKHLYTFIVDKNASKNMVAKVVGDKFGVTVIGVSTVNTKPKIKMQRKVRKSYQVSGFKKAIVEIKKGQKIAIFESPKGEEAVVTTGEGEPTVMREKKEGLLRQTKVKIEKGISGAVSTTQRKVITG